MLVLNATKSCHFERDQNEYNEFRKSIMKLRRRFYEWASGPEREKSKTN